MVDRLPTSSDRAAVSVVGFPLADRLLLFLGLPAAGVLIALALPPLARWVLGLSVGLPMRPVFIVVGAADQWWEVAISLAGGAVLGLALALMAVTEALKVTLTDAELRLDKDDRTRTIARTDVDAVFLDGKTLVVLDRESRQLVRDQHEAGAAALARAFRAHRYPWRDADPYGELFNRWVPDTPDLPPAVNAVLAARESALKEKAGRDVRELRDAVEKLGFVIRDEDFRQYWRPLVRS